MAKKIIVLLSFIVLVVVFAAQSSFAACQPFTKGTSGSTIKVAVAANFLDPAIDMIVGTLPLTDSFFDQNNINNTTVIICDGATGDFAAEIAYAVANNQPVPYDVFFAADETAMNNLPSAFDGFPTFVYSKGKPIIFGKKARVTNVSGLVDKIGSTAVTGSINPITTTYSIKSSAQDPVAVANPATAPYGAAAVSIMTQMGVYGTTYKTQYPTVGGALNAVLMDTNKSGFISKAQICQNLGNFTYVEFPSEQLDQTVRQLTANANPLINYIEGKIYSTPVGSSISEWNTFLTNHCYGTIP